MASSSSNVTSSPFDYGWNSSSDSYPVFLTSCVVISRDSSSDEADAIAALINLPSRSQPEVASTCNGTDKVVIAGKSFAPNIHQSLGSSSISLCAMSSRGLSENVSIDPIPQVKDVDPIANGTWYSGVTSLAIPEDDDVLSTLHIFMRKHCIEAFSATPEDVGSPRYGKSRNGKIVVGQVGIRCLHCKHLQITKRPERAVCYPSSLLNIYHAIETWHRRHFTVCTHIPTWVRREMSVLMKLSRRSAGGRRRYWKDAARQVGLIDTPNGVRFCRPPGMIVKECGIQKVKEPKYYNDFSQSKAIVCTTDRMIVTEYLFLLMNQMQTCYFTDEDRDGGRSKSKKFENGFPGIECKHCHGKSGIGRYFPSCIESLALANSERNIFNHLIKCRKCPQSIKSQLREFRESGESHVKHKRGLRKTFFQNIWNRIHSEQNE
jgi:hypothetical protein